MYFLSSAGPAEIAFNRFSPNMRMPLAFKDVHGLRFAWAWAMPVTIGWAALQQPGGPWWAWATLATWQVALALAECMPVFRLSPPAAPMGWFHRAVIRLHFGVQAALLAQGLFLSLQPSTSTAAVVALGLAIGGITGAQGITYAHELGHSRSRWDRMLAWGLMASVGYVHFMIEHYRGHHRHVATKADPASARWGESLWAFLPRTLKGSWVSAWNLESQRLDARGQGWSRSPLAWMSAVQALGLVILGWMGGGHALLFWMVQAVYAIFLLETVNYIEHYGLQRRQTAQGLEPFGIHHAWNTDRWWTNCILVNLQRHSDHHKHATKPYSTLDALDGPQLPTGYVGCLFLAMVPPWWRHVMHSRWPLQGVTESDSSA